MIERTVASRHAKCLLPLGRRIRSLTLAIGMVIFAGCTVDPAALNGGGNGGGDAGGGDVGGEGGGSETEGGTALDIRDADHVLAVGEPLVTVIEYVDFQ